LATGGWLFVAEELLAVGNWQLATGCSRLLFVAEYGIEAGYLQTTIGDQDKEVIV
jgi:hypothetical protein